MSDLHLPCLCPSNPDIFKAYDVRGTYPDQINEDAARAIGAAFVAYLKAKRIAVGRDMRLSSPALAQAFIDGATSQGRDVVDYGMIPTDMLYFAVAQRRARRRRQDHRLAQPEAVQRHEDGAARGVPAERRGGHLRHPRHDRRGHDRRRRPRSRGTVTTKDVLDAYVDHVMGFIDPSLVKPFNVVLDAGSGMGGLVAPKLFDRLPCRTTRLCFEIDGRFPNHEANPLIEENRRRHHRACAGREGRHRHRVGRRRRPLLLHRRHRRVHLRRLHHGAARRGVSAEAPRRDDHLRPARQLRRPGRGREVRRHVADEPGRPRVLQAADARDQRASSAARSRGTTTSATTSTRTTASSRRC